MLKKSILLIVFTAFFKIAYSQWSIGYVSGGISHVTVPFDSLNDHIDSLYTSNGFSNISLTFSGIEWTSNPLDTDYFLFKYTLTDSNNNAFYVTTYIPIILNTTNHFEEYSIFDKVTCIAANCSSEECKKKGQNCTPPCAPKSDPVQPQPSCSRQVEGGGAGPIIGGLVSSLITWLLGKV